MNIKKMSKPTIALLSVLLALLISMIGTSLVQSNGGSVKVSTYTGSLNNLATMITNNTKENGKKVDIQFQHDFSTQTAQICFMKFIPPNATKENPAPCIICVHGNNNSKEMQLENFTELSKRGFVVISVDMSSEGRTDPDIDKYTKGTQGTLAATEYAMSLDCVDNNKIGMTGHSGGETTCYNTIKAINAPKSNNHIAAWFCSSGTMAAVSMKPANTTDLIWGVAAGKFDEVDTSFFGTNKFLSSMTALGLMKVENPSYNAPSIPEGKWFTSTGAIDTPAPGKALGVKSAVAFWNPPYTHPMGTFSTKATKLAIDFFYAAFGTPSGASYIAATSQTWPIAVAFQLLGLLAFFGLALPLVSVLLKIPAFSSLKREVTAQKDLPSIKNWKEWVPLVVTFIPLILFPYFTYFKYYDKGTALFDSTSYPMGTVNGIAWWTFCCGLFCILMLGVNYALRKLCHINDKEPVYNPFTPGKLDGGRHFLKIVGFVATVMVLMYVPCFIAYNVFHMNFGIAVYTVGLPRMQWLPDMIFKYLPFWIVFLVPNVILNADTRFKEVPEWATVVFCAAANALPIMVLTYINYSTLFSTGLLWNSSSQPGIMAYNLFAPMIFIAISGRYIYKRTGNAWTAGMINASILAFMALTLTMHNTSLMFHL